MWCETGVSEAGADVGVIGDQGALEQGTTPTVSRTTSRESFQDVTRVTSQVQARG